MVGRDDNDEVCGSDDDDGAGTDDDEVWTAGEGEGDGESMPGSVSHPPLHTTMVCNTLVRSDGEDEVEEEDEEDDGTRGGGGGLSAIDNALSISPPLSTTLFVRLL